jgi:RHS repeat-associated protein
MTKATNSVNKTKVERISRNLFFSLFLLLGGVSIPVLCLSSPAAAQSDSSKVNYTADRSLRSNARINPSTLAMEFSLPLPGFPGRAGSGISGSLNYSSKVWTSGNPGHADFGLGDRKTIYPSYAETSDAGWTSTLGVPQIDYTVNTYEDGGLEWSANAEAEPTTDFAIYYIKRLRVVMPDGSSHELRADDARRSYGTAMYPSLAESDKNSGTFLSVDGSRMRLEWSSEVVNGNTVWHNVLYMPDGGRYFDLPPFKDVTPVTNTITYIDRSGNKMTYDLTTGKWTDTMGREIVNPISIGYPTAQHGAGTQTLHYPGLTGGSTTQDISLVWAALDTQQSSLYYIAPSDCNTSGNSVPSGANILFYLYNGSSNRVCGNSTTFDPAVLTAIVLPNGAKYKFSYNVWGEIVRIDYPTGGYERFEYAELPALLATGKRDLDQYNRGVVDRWISPDGTSGSEIHWSYAVQKESTSSTQGPYHVKTYAPDGTWSEQLMTDRYHHIPAAYGFEDPMIGLAYETRVYDNTTSNTLLRRTLTSYTTTGPLTIGGLTGESNASRDLRPEKSISIIFESGATSALATMSETVYDTTDTTGSSDPAYFSSLNVKQTKNYNFKILTSLTNAGSYNLATIAANFSSGDVASVAEADYLYNSNYKTRNITGLVTESRVTDGSGNVKAKSQIGYDESGFITSSSGTMPSAATGSYLSAVTELGSTVGSKRGLPTSVKSYYDISNSNYIETHAFYDQYGNTTGSRDGKGNDMVMDYDAADAFVYPTSVTTAASGDGTFGSSSGFTTSSTYDYNTGLTLTTTDINDQVTHFSYLIPSTSDPDPLLRLRTVTAPNDAETITEYGVPDTTGTTAGQFPSTQRFVHIKTQIDATNWKESYTWGDALGRTIKSQMIDSNGDVFSETEYDNMGRVKRTTNPYRTGETKQWTTPTYDELGRTTVITSPDSSTIQTAFGLSASSPVGLTKTVTDQAGKKRTGISDALGRMVRVIEDPDSQNLSTDYLFDTLGNLRKTTQGGQYRYFMHDDLGRLLYAKQPEQEANTNFSATDPVTSNTAWSVKYEYDANGNITKTTDANNVYVEGTYDNLNRLTLRNYSDSTPDVTFYYDGKYLDINDASQTATGSVKGKATCITSSVSRTNYKSFDNLGRLLTNQQITDGVTYDFGYQYNLSGALIEETYPSGRIVKNTLNSDGELSLVQAKKNSSTGYYAYAMGFDYNSSGALNKMRLGNGHWETYLYNNRQQVTQIGLGTTDTVQDILKLEYGYNTSGNHDNNGAMLTQKITVPTVGSYSGFAATQTYTYDSLNRLDSAAETVSSSQTWKQTFTYDRYGNRRFNTSGSNTTTLNSLLPSKETNPLINTSDNRFQKDQDSDTVTDYDYDKNGSLILDASGRRFVYDAEGRQKSFFIPSNSGSTPDATYYYDGNGQRVKKISSTETTVFVYDGSGQLSAEYSTDLATTPQVSYLTIDHLGSPRIITNEAGEVTKRQDYTAFGEETVTADRTSGLKYTNPDELRQGYTGYQKDDESGLDFAQARYYNSAHGRFTSVDPLTASAAIKNPQTFNRYTYALNSPYKFTDPLGLAAQDSARPHTLIDFNTIGEVTVINPYPNASAGGENSVVTNTSGVHGGNSGSSPGGSGNTSQAAGSPAAPSAQTSEQNAESPGLLLSEWCSIPFPGEVYFDVVVEGMEGPTENTAMQSDFNPSLVIRTSGYGATFTFGLRNQKTGEFLTGYKYEIKYFSNSSESDPNHPGGTYDSLGENKIRSIPLVKDKTGAEVRNDNIPEGATGSYGADITIYNSSGGVVTKISLNVDATMNSERKVLPKIEIVSGQKVLSITELRK